MAESTSARVGCSPEPPRMIRMANARHAAHRHRRQRAAGPVPGGRVRGRARSGCASSPRVQVFGEVWNLGGSGQGLLRAARRARRAARARCGAPTSTSCGRRAGRRRPDRGRRRLRLLRGQPHLLALVHLPRRATCAWPARASCWPRSSGCASKLDAEGLFEPQKRLPRPALPRTIGVVTGETRQGPRRRAGRAARRGWQGRLVWALRAGAGPPRRAGDHPRAAGPGRDGRVDTIVVARGGGSVMDLMAFSRRDAVPHGRAARRCR